MQHVRDRAGFVRLYGEIIPELYLTCTMISNVDLPHYGVSRAKDLISMDFGTIISYAQKCAKIGIVLCITGSVHAARMPSRMHKCICKIHVLNAHYLCKDHITNDELSRKI